MKIFISQPMRDKSMIEIVEERKRIEKMFDGNEFIDSVIKDVPEMEGNTRLWCLGESIKRMKDADLVVSPSNAYNYAGCEIEAQVACMYGIPMCRILMYPHKEEDRYSYANCEAVCEAR
ncbi:MAG: hypothetical protein MJZ12_01750 [Prevotella sp.]|nr:hypothetical protein [Prevotella sp.]